MHAPINRIQDKAVRWRSTRFIDIETQKGQAGNRKRYAVRDQPTWYNCKFQKTPIVRDDTKEPQRDSGKAVCMPRFEEIQHRNGMVSPRRDFAPSSTPVSARSFSRASEAKATPLQRTDYKYSSAIGDIVTMEYETDDMTGRDIMKKKAREATSASTRTSSVENASQSIASSSINRAKRNCSQHLKNFRITSAESSHRSADITIGIRHISRMLQLSMEGQQSRGPTQRQRSASTLCSLTKITSDNLNKIRRRSEPTPAAPMRYQDQGSSTPAPGEGYFEARRASLSAPATRGGKSSENTTARAANSHRTPRPFPKVLRSVPFSDREWRPPILQKFSLKQPWAPRQQTTRYFPKHNNMQDVHCRNPYLVPESILYKSRALLE